MKRLAYRWLSRVINLRPMNVCFGLLLYSLVLLLMVAPTAGTWEHSRVVRGVIQAVGYNQTLNWAWAFTLFFPFAAFFLLRAARFADSIPRRLVAAEMLRAHDGEAPRNALQLAEGRWTKVKKEHASWWLIATVIGILESLGEWVMTSAWPLYSRTFPIGRENDWSTVAFQETDVLPRVLSGGFSFLVFVQQAIMISFLGLLIFLTLSMAAYLSDLRRSGQSIRLFPSLSRCGRDSRLGFEELVPFFESLLLSVVLIYVHLFCSRVWNAFLHPDENEKVYSTVWELIKNPLQHGAGTGVNGASNAFLQYLDQLGAMNYSGLAVSLGGVVLIGVFSAFLIFSLRGTATDARRENLSFDLDESSAECLERMNIWPLKYPGLNTLLALSFLGALSMLVYRLGIYFCGAAILSAIVWATKNLQRE